LKRYVGAVNWLAPLTGFLGGVVGAALAGLVAWRTNSSRMAADIQARWDAALLERGTDFVTATRSLRHHAERFQRSADQTARRTKIDEAQEQLRVLSEQLRLVGDSRVQVAARRVVHHAYAVRVQGEEGRDPRAEDYPDLDPISRLNDALQEFHRAVRAQLRAPDAEDVLHDDELASIGLKALTVSQRSTHA
jgi:4-amino-4-deoxy-L-arabinose transferase-like glycosyltransferase